MEPEITISIHATDDESGTVAVASLDLHGEHFEAVGEAHRNPIDPPRPRIGEELAIARALARLEADLLEAARDKIDRYLVH